MGDIVWEYEAVVCPECGCELDNYASIRRVVFNLGDVYVRFQCRQCLKFHWIKVDGSGVEFLPGKFVPNV